MRRVELLIQKVVNLVGESLPAPQLCEYECDWYHEDRKESERRQDEKPLGT